MMLLPCSPDVCQYCAVDHPPGQPHNAQSLYYQYHFYGRHGRWPTWADAVAHCEPAVRAAWELALRRKKAWSEPAEGPALADPPGECSRAPVGDVHEPGFGPPAAVE